MTEETEWGKATGQNWLRHHSKDFIKNYPLGGVGKWEVIELRESEESRAKKEKYYLDENWPKAWKQRWICHEKQLETQCQQVIYSEGS